MSQPDDNTQTESIDPVGDALNLQAEIENLRAEKQSIYEKLARAQADFANSRARIENDFNQRIAYSNQKLIESLLPIIDNFERALAQDPAKADSATILKGMQLVHDQWLATLAKEEVAEIAPKSGEDFDPQRHTAIMQQSSDLPAGKVTQLLQKGYSLRGRVMRAAGVAVSKGSSS